MDLKLIRFRELPLGARFKYKKDGKEIYVLLDRAGSGLVASLWQVGRPHALQGIYSAFDSTSACRDAEVWAVVDANGF